MVFYFHFGGTRKYRNSHIQNIIIFWYCIYDNISQGKGIFHLGARAITEGLTFHSSTVLMDLRKPYDGLKCNYLHPPPHHHHMAN